MAFIKAQKLTYDKDGRITGGSAAIVDTIYGDFGSYHAKHRVREKLGKVLFLSSDKKSGIFLSPLRGLVEYDATSDTFSDVDRDDISRPHQCLSTHHVVLYHAKAVSVETQLIHQLNQRITVEICLITYIGEIEEVVGLLGDDMTQPVS